jgi:uncharacterized protein (TIGR02145 family)
LFTTSDYLDITNSKIVNVLCNLAGDTDYYKLLGSFFICIANKTFSDISHRLFDIQEPKDNNSNFGSYTDIRDGYTYKTIKIGNQIWMAENLRYLPQIGNGYYVYNYQGNYVNEAKETQNYKDFGVLYNMSAAKEACPDGWHIPSDVEWKELEHYLGITDFSKEKCIAVYDLKHFFRGNNQGSNLMANNIETKVGDLMKNKTKDYGFNASLGGWRYYDGEFGQKHLVAMWWSNSVHSPGDNAYHSDRFYIYRVLYYNESGIGYDCCSEECCLSLRCIKNDSVPFSEMPYKEMNSIPYPMSTESAKRKIKELFMQVVKDPYYNYLAIINTLIGKECSNSKIISPIWIPTKMNNNLSVVFVREGSNIKCTYSQNGNESFFITECNTRNIDDVVKITYDLFNRLGLVGYFISNGPKAIDYINKYNILNDRKK